MIIIVYQEVRLCVSSDGLFCFVSLLPYLYVSFGILLHLVIVSHYRGMTF